MQSSTTGSHNVGMGHAALGEYGITAFTGTANVAIGNVAAGYIGGAASYNTYVGAGAGSGSSGTLTANDVVLHMCDAY